MQEHKYLRIDSPAPMSVMNHLAYALLTSIGLSACQSPPAMVASSAEEQPHLFSETPISIPKQLVDWKYLGAFGASNLATGVDLSFFYLANDIQYKSPGYFKTWTKGLEKKEVDQILGALDPNSHIIRRTAEKLAESYVPPYLKLSAVSFEQRLAISSAEEIANDSALKAKIMALYEINCLDRQIRTLSILLTKENGDSSSSNKPTEWVPIAPETISWNLAALICSISPLGGVG